MPPIPTTEKRPFIPAPGVVQLEAVYTYLQQAVENVYHFKQGSLTDPYTITQMDALAAAFEAWEHDTARVQRDAGATLTMIRIRDMTVQGGVVREYSPTTAVIGLMSGGHLPGNVTIAVKWQTALGGRSHRGRSFHIGFSDTMRDGNQITAGGQTALKNAYTLLLSGMTESAGSTLSVVSNAHNKFWRDVAEVTPIVACSVDINLDSQRRRLNGRGA